MSWKKWRICKNMKIVLTLLIITVSLIAGCDLTNKLVLIDDSKRVAFVDVNDIVPFRGVLITEGRHNFLLRCEDIIIQSGIRP